MYPQFRVREPSRAAGSSSSRGNVSLRIAPVRTSADAQRLSKSVMDGIDPDTLLEWLQTGAGLERDLQVSLGERTEKTKAPKELFSTCRSLC